MAVPSQPPVPDRLLAEYFDGRQARGQLVELVWSAHHLCLLRPGQPGVEWLRVPHSQVQWSELTRHGLPQAHMDGGGSLRALDAAQWHAWLRHHRPQSLTWVVRAQQSWRGVLLALAALVLAVAGLWRFGIPVAAQVVVPLVPLSLEQRLGEATLEWLDGELTHPSELPAAQRSDIARRFATMLEAGQRSASSGLAAQTTPPPPAYQLHFRQSRIGPNAFALPGGAIVLTDEMVSLLGHDTDVLLGVLAHELGHVHHRHGTAQLVQVTLLGALSALVLGDVGSWVTSVPVLLGQAGYSRQAEREADAHAARVLAAAGVSPAVMVRLFDVLAAREGRGPQAPEAVRTLGIAIASHPDDGERRRFFSEAALSLPGR